MYGYGVANGPRMINVRCSSNSAAPMTRSGDLRSNAKNERRSSGGAAKADAAADAAVAAMASDAAVAVASAGVSVPAEGSVDIVG